MAKSKLLQMHNVGIVVESLDHAISFFEELGFKLEGQAMVEGEWAGRVTGLGFVTFVGHRDSSSDWRNISVRKQQQIF